MSDAAESRQEQFSGTKDVAETHKFDEKRLEQYMAAHVEGFQGPLTVKQFKGGQSNPTYQLVTPSKKYVLRRKPPGKLLPSAHAVDREYKVITALHGEGFAAPREIVGKTARRFRVGLLGLLGGFGEAVLILSDLIEERFPESVLLVGVPLGGGPAGFAEGLLLSGEGAGFPRERFALVALFREHFGKGRVVVFEHLPELAFDPALFYAELLGFALLPLGKLFRVVVGGITGQFRGFALGSFRPLPGFSREFLLAVGECAESGDGPVVLFRFAHRQGELIEIADRLLDFFPGGGGLGEAFVFVIGDGNQVGAFLCLGE